MTVLIIARWSKPVCEDQLVAALQSIKEASLDTDEATALARSLLNATSEDEFQTRPDLLLGYFQLVLEEFGAQCSLHP